MVSPSVQQSCVGVRDNNLKSTVRFIVATKLAILTLGENELRLRSFAVD